MAKDTSIERFSQLNAAKRDESARSRSGHAFKLVRVYTDKITPNPRNPRQIDLDALSQDGEFQDLVESVRVHGVLQPILVRQLPTTDGESRYELVAGERRWRASLAAGLESVPAVISTYDDSQAQIAALVENLQRQDIRPIDEARGFRHVMDAFALSESRLGELIGKSRSYVNNRLRLLQCSQELVSELDAHDSPISAQHVLLLQGIENDIRQAFIDEVKRTGAGYNRMLERKKVWDELSAAHPELADGEAHAVQRETAARWAAQGLSLGAIEERLQGRKPATRRPVSTEPSPTSASGSFSVNDLQTLRLASKALSDGGDPQVPLNQLIKALEADLRKARQALFKSEAR